MEMTFEFDALVGTNFQPGELQPFTGATVEYETEYVGKVKMTLSAYRELLEGNFERYAIAGICKSRTVKGEEPLLIDSEFIREGFRKLNPPMDFEEKLTSFIKFLYENGGRTNKEFEFNSMKNCGFAYADPEEFTRLMDELATNRYITIRKIHPMGRDASHKIYMGVKMTSAGKDEAKKALPKIPMFGLVNQEISTGDKAIDEKINQARKLFFDEPQSLTNMRSACETLAFILEPLREDLKNYLAQKDVSDFFQIVNTFDIRHNKDATKNIVQEEQMEWVFYTLLNTLNTYTKLKNNGK